MPNSFRHNLVAWAKQRSELSNFYMKRQTFCVFGDGEPVVRQAIRVTARAGAAVLW